MTRFVQGVDRTQATFFPESLDEYVSEDNPVRIIDLFVDQLELMTLGFASTQPKDTGRPSYHPATLLKLYIYGYLNRVQSSRRLERECGRNVEVMWLTGRLSPDHKTISDFRKNNGKAIKKVCKEFVLLCRKVGLFTDAIVAIDGSKFKAVNHYDKNFSKTKVKFRISQLEKSINRYLGEIATADRIDSTIHREKKERLAQKIKKVEAEIEKIKTIGKLIDEGPDEQISLTDPDCRSMRTKSKSSGTVGYNVQTAVDSKNHMIVAHEVTITGSDRAQLNKMAQMAKQAVGHDHLEALADRGYYSGVEIRDCLKNDITPYVPKSYTSGNQAKGQYGKRDFRYIAEDDEYECPAGERAIYRYSRVEGGKLIRRYWSSACIHCEIRSQCTSGQYRRISRWEHEQVLDEMQDRLDRAPDKMATRRSTVEHPFGTLKAWMGATHFTTKTMKRVSTEMSLHVLAYNLKRAINILGCKQLIAAMSTT
jgi:transposase